MKTDQEVREVFNMITTRPAKILNAYADGIQEGAPADLTIHNAETLVDIFRNLPGRRLHVKNGALVGGLEGSMWTAS